MIRPKTIRSFQHSLLRWYRRHGRDLPWRHTRDPYAILVSEFMLQQTQVATVVPYYYRWLRRFPGFRALARASESQVLHAWQGLGYYTRAGNLHRSAKQVVKLYGGILPRQVSELRDLPGIGCYTANAIASFAFGQPVPVVDANIARVIARLFDERAKIDSAPGKRRIWQHAAELLPAPNSAEHNSALMDLGALVCTARKPKCHICPVREFCGAPDPERLPLKRARPRTVRLTENHALVVRGDKILLVQATNRWRGMWILPPLKDGRVKGSSSRPGAIYKSVFPFTHHRVTFSVFRRERQKEERRCQRWFSTSELNSIPIPSPHRRAISNLLNG